MTWTTKETRLPSASSTLVSPNPSPRPVKSCANLPLPVTAPKHLLNEFADEDAEDPFAATAQSRQIAARQGEYHARKFDRETGVRVDAFAPEGAAGAASTSAEGASGYGEVMRLAELERQEQRVKQAIQKQKEDGLGPDGQDASMAIEAPDATPRRKRWDVVEPERPAAAGGDVEMKEVGKGGEWDDANTASKDAVVVKKKRSRWDETPVGTAGTVAGAPGETPKRSRWDQTPVGVTATPMAMQFGMTPVAGMSGMMLMGGGAPGARYLSDEELDQMLPSEGYEIVEPPAGYAPIRTPARKLQETPMGMTGGFIMQEEGSSGAGASMGQELPTDIEGVGDLAFFKQEDAQYFAKVCRGTFGRFRGCWKELILAPLQILGDQDESALSMDELKERKIMRLLLKVKNGTPPMRKTALRQITDKAREFGAGPLFDKILPLLMERTLEDQERHLLVKVIDRVLYKLDDLVRPYVHKILVVIEPLLIDEDYYARV